MDVLFNFKDEFKTLARSWVMKPNLTFGDSVELVKVPSDSRAIMDHWWHIRCANHLRPVRLSKLRTAPVDDAEAFLRVSELIGPEIQRQRAIFLGGTHPLKHTFRPGQPPVFIPVFLKTADYIPYHLNQAINLQPGTYITDEAFAHHGEFESKRLRDGRYMFEVQIINQGGEVASWQHEVSVESYGAVDDDIHLTVVHKTVAESWLQLAHIRATLSPRLTALRDVGVAVEVDGPIGRRTFRWDGDTQNGTKLVALLPHQPAELVVAAYSTEPSTFLGTAMSGSLCYLTDEQFRHHHDSSCCELNPGQHRLTVTAAHPTGCVSKIFVLSVPHGVDERLHLSESD